jgi:hypothetical protein
MARRADGPRYAALKVTAWNDSDFLKLPATSQRLYLVIISQSEISLCGVQTPAYKRWSTYAPDTTPEGLEVDCKPLVDGHFVLIDEGTDEMLVRTFVHHNVGTKSDNSVVGASRAYEAIHSKTLRKVVMEELRKDLDHDLWNRLARAIPDGDAKALRERVSKVFLRDWESPS